MVRQFQGARVQKMATKLTLRVEEELIEHAKSHARKRGISLSQMVSQYFALLPAEASSEKAEVDVSALPPVTASLWGLLVRSNVQEEDYRIYLAEKYQ